MKDNYYIIDNEEEDSPFQLKEILSRYLKYWPWFIIAVIVSMLSALLYLRYASVVYSSVAKIKIIDDTKELDVTNDPLSLLAGGAKINVDNEIEILKSYRILDQVVTSLNLEISYYEEGNIKTKKIFNPPFSIKKYFPNDSLKESTQFYLDFEKNPPEISDSKGVVKKIDSNTVAFSNTNYPIEIHLNVFPDFSKFKSKQFSVKIRDKKEAVLDLAKNLEINLPNKNSEVLYLNLDSESPDLSEAILNEIINKFNEDGVLDRQLVSKRTMDFIDERFVFLSETLDSIEIEKKDFKKTNNLSYIEVDANTTLQKKSSVEKEVFQLETQIALSKLLKENLSLNNNDFQLLPSDVGLDNDGINNLVFQYNSTVLEREKLIVSAGINNPSIKVLSDQLINGRKNILNTINNYLDQLTISLNQLNGQKNITGAIFSKLPEKEKMLRAIERQQSIKENLFLLLLQKREEAAINFAVTAPSIKVVDYGLTDIKPIYPKKPLVLLAAICIGLFLPFVVLFIKFKLDTKINNKSDIEKLASDIPILAEIPTFKDPNNFIKTNEKSTKAESFRILATNVKFLLTKKQNDLANIILVTSSIKGEGKTTVTLNLAVALSNFDKKVLLIGADLRNPQLHNYFETDKSVLGLSNFLHDPKIDWKDCIHKPKEENVYLDICFSGPIPPNSAQILSRDHLSDFLDEARKEYDYIILDTAPTIQVADTLLISNHADVTVYVMRSKFTDKRLTLFSKDLSLNKKLNNMAYVLNDVGFNKTNGYNYGYEYGYGGD